ncbi:immunity 49 family protein [Streptomyces poriferorum]|uniref:Immunity 49 family protein n=2 Tax=Streptomyces TaxID=1883 RepID=A0ABY9IGS4_9ACTN|nr:MULTISPECIES: immunity 49 family protein [unclassified Streptomyces]MDP5316081.1 immunity 49 family protein [Streptomyces sp. Alt4]WLQ52817.1 immunity 49 family protein [Streptomyces sp. Alt1]WLQ54422.1 immunity 49 family protein [Streptomyces sp. Alt2]WSI67717.1 immunity 49 family protein [Streptomyces sp. NBC_01336]
MAQREIKARYAQAEAAELWDRAREYAQELDETPAFLHEVGWLAQKVSGYQSISDPRATEGITRESWTLAAEAYAAIFAVTRAPIGSTVHCPVMGDRNLQSGEVPRHYASVETWLDAIWLSIICRNERELLNLCSIPADWLRESGGAQVDSVVFQWANTLQSYFTKAPGFLDLLYATMEETAPEELTVSPHYILQIAYPAMELLYHLSQQDSTGFNEALEEALNLHHHFWTSDPELAGSPYGFTAKGPLALACIAEDMGMQVTVESEYLPHSMIKGFWLPGRQR